jgi:hypothetical protein
MTIRKKVRSANLVVQGGSERISADVEFVVSILRQAIGLFCLASWPALPG